MDLRKKDKREGHQPQVARSARFLETEDGWFFRTREDIMMGPYADKFDAEVSASLLIAQLAQLEDGKDPAAVIQAFENDPSNATVRNAHQPKRVDLKAIRRKHHFDMVRGRLQKTWATIARSKRMPNAQK